MALREESGTWPTRRRAMPGVAPEARASCPRLRRHLAHRDPVGLGRGRESGAVERADRYLAALDAHAHRIAGTIEVGVGLEEAALLGPRPARHAVDVVVAVLLDVLQAEQAREGQILLHREPGLRGEVLAGHEERRPSLVRV